MNSDNSVVDYAREVIRDWLERFEQHARLSIDNTTPVEVDVSQLVAAAQRYLAALALCEGYCLQDSRRRVRNFLHEAAKIASGMIEVRFIPVYCRRKRSCCWPAVNSSEKGPICGFRGTADDLRNFGGEWSSNVLMSKRGNS